MKTILFVIVLIFSSSAYAKIIGKDNRVKVTSHSKDTWGTGVVYAEYSGNRFYKCSGTLISHYQVLTAAHCTFQPNLGGYPKQISFIPGVLKTKTGSNDRFFATSAWINQNYLQNKKRQPDALFPSHDIAILTLSKNHDGKIPGKSYGYKGYTHPDNVNREVALVAYKNEGKDIHTLYKHGNCSALLSTARTYLSTKCDSSEGASGGGLINSSKKIIGLLSGGNDGSNYYTPITPRFIGSINAVVKGKKPKYDFIQKKLNAAPYYGAHFLNKCHRKIYVAFTYRNLDEEWITDGFIELKPGQASHNMFKTRNKVLAFYVQTYKGDLKWKGDDYKFTVQGEKYPFYKKRIEGKFKDRTFGWSCPS